MIPYSVISNMVAIITTFYGGNITILGKGGRKVKGSYLEDMMANPKPEVGEKRTIYTESSTQFSISSCFNILGCLRSTWNMGGTL